MFLIISLSLCGSSIINIFISSYRFLFSSYHQIFTIVDWSRITIFIFLLQTRSTGLPPSFLLPPSPHGPHRTSPSSSLKDVSFTILTRHPAVPRVSPPPRRTSSAPPPLFLKPRVPPSRTLSCKSGWLDIPTPRPRGRPRRRRVIHFSRSVLSSLPTLAFWLM